MACPTFKMHGSKARMAVRLCDHFPHGIARYAEPFAGRGNVFFRAAMHASMEKEPAFLLDSTSEVKLNDLYMGHFLKTLRTYNGNYNFIPEAPITRAKFEYFKALPLSSPERALAESCVAYNGNLFGGGANITENSLNIHSKENTIRRLRSASYLLALYEAQVSALDWVTFLDEEVADYGKEDFIYFDPPYIHTKTFYPNIDYGVLFSHLNKATYRWALSNYPCQELEDELHYKNSFLFTRNSTAKNSNGTKGNTVQEVLYTNY